MLFRSEHVRPCEVPSSASSALSCTRACTHRVAAASPSVRASCSLRPCPGDPYGPAAGSLALTSPCSSCIACDAGGCFAFVSPRSADPRTRVCRDPHKDQRPLRIEGHCRTRRACSTTRGKSGAEANGSGIRRGRQNAQECQGRWYSRKRLEGFGLSGRYSGSGEPSHCDTPSGT